MKATSTVFLWTLFIAASNASASLETYFWGSEGKEQCYSKIGEVTQPSINKSCSESEAPIYNPHTGAYDLNFKYLDESLFGNLTQILPKNPSQKIDLMKFINDETNTVKLAQWLIKRKSLQQSLEDKAPEVDFFFGSEIKQIFPSKYIDSIIKNGFMNSYQTGHSGGAPERPLIESMLINATINIRAQHEKLFELLPKYALFDLPEKFIKRQFIRKDTNQFGNIIAVYKDKIKSRATVTCGDSLDMWAFSGLFSKSRDLRNLTPYLRTKKHLCFDYTIKPYKNIEYWEAQIWGKLTIKDVKHFIIGCEEFQPISDADLKNLIAVGAPIYKCVERKDAKGRLLKYDAGELIE